MMEKYNEYMLANFPQDLMDQWLKCFEFSTAMQAEFPELTLRKGYVYSSVNIDNYSDQYPRQYPHAWLTTPWGEIVDPTVLQFSLLGPLVYVETEHYHFKCGGCGQFQPQDEDYCGKCEWSE
jgi:hypothetical protein